jgi:hypothetical protein
LNFGMSKFNIQKLCDRNTDEKKNPYRNHLAL